MKLKKALLVIPILIASAATFGGIFSADVFAAAPQIRITEIMYDPLGNGDKEFIEIYNGSDTAANLAGWSFSNGVNYSFPSSTTLEPGKYGVVVRNSSAFRGAYPSARVFGQYVGKLLGSGELVRLIDKNGAAVTQVDYRSGGAWPSNARNGGPSLSLIKVSGDETSPACWGSSTSSGGSPGFANSASGGGSCPNKSYLTTPPSSPSQQNPAGSSGNQQQGGSGSTTPGQGSGTPGNNSNPTAGEQPTDPSDQTLQGLSPEELAILEKEGKLEDAEDGTGEVTKLGSTDSFIKKLAGLLLGCFIIFLGVGYVAYDKLIKHGKKHPIYSKIHKKVSTFYTDLKRKLKI